MMARSARSSAGPGSGHSSARAAGVAGCDLFTGGYGAGGMLTAALSLAVFTVMVGVGQMFVITLGPGNVDLSLPANIGLASAVAMKTMGGDDSMVAVGLAAALGSGFAIGVANYLLIWALRIPPIIATLSASFVIQSIDISYGRRLDLQAAAVADVDRLDDEARRQGRDDRRDAQRPDQQIVGDADRKPACRAPRRGRGRPCNRRRPSSSSRPRWRARYWRAATGRHCRARA